MQSIKKIGLYFIYLALIGNSAPAAFAEDSGPALASLSLQFSGLKWDQTKTKYSDEDSARESTSLMTGDLVDASVYAAIGKVNLYFYPFLDLNSLVSIGYMIQDNLEVGIDLGLNASKIKEPKNELSSDLMGAFTTWTVAFDGFALENFAVLDFTRVESTMYNSTTNEDDKTKVTGTFMKVSSTVVVPIAKNAFYMGGIWLAAERNKNDTLDVTKNSTQFGLMLAGLRLTVD